MKQRTLDNERQRGLAHLTHSPPRVDTRTTFVLRQYAIPAITKRGAARRRTPPEHQLKNLLKLKNKMHLTSFRNF